MTITVNDHRRATIETPAEFSIEAATVLVKGINANAATLELVLFSSEGVTLAACRSWTGDATAGYSGTLDARTAAMVALFAAARADERKPGIIALADANRNWLCQGAEIVNNPLIGTPVTPDPAKVYLTADLFADLPVLTSASTTAERGAVLKTISERLANR